MTATAQHAAWRVPEREHVPGPHDLVWLGRRVDQRPDGLRPVGGRDASGHAIAGFHADGVRGPHPLGVLARHQRELEAVQHLAWHRDADHAAGVPDHKGQQGRSGLARGEDDVALVLPVGIVDDHDGPPGRDVRDGAGDVVQARTVLHAARLLSHWFLPASSRSTYLAIMSTSMLTTSPGRLRPSVVRARVSGIRLTSNQDPSASSPSPETVRLMPSTATDPFRTT